MPYTLYPTSNYTKIQKKVPRERDFWKIQKEI
jgi:hypothetical protein